MAKNNNNSFELGKIPPQSIDVEEAVLGAILVEGKCLQDVIEYLKPETFYKEANKTLYAALVSLYDKRKPIDLLTVSQELRDTNTIDEVGGVVYLAQLTSKVGSASHIEYHSKILAEKYIRREFIRLSNELQQTMYDDNMDILSNINDFDNAKMNILSFTANEEVHIRKAINEMIDYSAKLNQNLIPKGLPTGYSYYDDFSGGIQRGDLFVIAGETSNGKTTLALNILKNTASHGTKAAIFSYEMTTFQLAARLVAHSEKISSKDIIRGAISPSSLSYIANNCFKLNNSELYIVKPSGSNFVKLKRDIVRMVKIYGLDMIVIDYLQLLSNQKHGANQAEMIGDIANSLKSLAVELNIAIIAISQLARDRANPRPAISRLKGSGDIENAADVVMFTYLPYKYTLAFENVNGESTAMNENAIIIVAKGRNIGTSEFVLEFKKDIPAFFNFHQSDLPMPTNDYLEPNKQFEPKDVTPF